MGSDGYNGFLPNGYLVATDSSGTILSEVKIQKGTSIYKLYTPQTYNKTRLNVYEIDVPTNPSDPTASYFVMGFLQIKKGSIYDISGSQTATSNYPLKLHFSNLANFQNLIASTDLSNTSITSISDTSQFNYFDYSDKSKLFVETLKNGKTLYNFFDLIKGGHSLNVDMNQCIKIPQVKTLRFPGSFVSMTVYAKPDKNSVLEYNLGTATSISNELSYYYPNESFDQYNCVTNYNVGSRQYSFVNLSSTISSEVNTYSANFTNTGTSLANYKTTVSGPYDYYLANFIGKNINNNISIYLYSPSAASYLNYKMPDFSKYISKTILDPSQIILQEFGLYQFDGFNESKLPYKDSRSYHDVNIKAVRGR
ncbi:hypothetical protein [Mucilaginibacter sp. KACC 22063]|uniref:hypothetical protein n=1 Tax=Mucilaginibacter sp. KACC 22063 TaxID=3025666 RepID=UPI002365CD93|nr:hypothetical protein [Mucilaginibacter sp. KACC 22063]WDF53355.1 hypothetical protein PQ461_10395 [Mucilaginibacter sp. KACC 22063]